jgi:hypothetical protein
MLGWLKNVATSGGNFLGNIGSAIAHPQNTLEGVTGLLQGMAEKTTGAPGANGVSHAPYVDGLVDLYKSRYGSWDGFKHALYTDPVGVAADVSLLADGVGAISKGVEAASTAAKLGTVAKVAGAASDVADTVSGVTNPLRLAGKVSDATGLSGLASRGADAVSAGLMKGGLRGGFTVATDTPNLGQNVADAVQTAQDLKIPVSNAGAAKIKSALDALRGQTADVVARADQAGATVDPATVELKLGQLRTKYAAQVNNAQDLSDIDKVLGNFRNEIYKTTPATQGTPASTILNPATGQPVTPRIAGAPASQVPVPIPVEKAQALKIGTYDANAAAYGSGAKVPPQEVAKVAAEKALAEGLREELEKQIPELAGLNSQQSKLLNLQGVVEGAVTKYNNKGLFGRIGSDLSSGLGLPGAAVGGALAYHDPILAGGAAALKILLSDPAVQSRLAMAVNSAQKLNPGKYGVPSMLTATARIRNYADSLTPSVPIQPAGQ